MSDASMIVSRCPSCHTPMDITNMPPFTRVACPACGETTRVKLEFGPYILERRLSKGGMSVLFVARDTLLNREVAVKILNEEYSNDEKRIVAFEEEARVTASLSHPNIVRVLTTGRAFGRFFIAMELVPGGHFENHIRTEGRIPEARMLKLAIQIAGGLKAAHEANLIHRDIKPGNLLLDADGNAKIVDFGLALVTQGGTAQAKEFWATPYYVPPETVEGKPEDFRSDIYAFGATLYHALAGKPPCNEESMAVHLLRAAKKNIVPLHKACPDLSMAVCEIVNKAMAYLPEDRYASYDDLLKDLQDAANHNNHGVKRVTAGEVATRQSRARQSKRMIVASAWLTAALLVICALAWITRTGNESPEPTPAITGNRANTGGNEEIARIVEGYEEAQDAYARRSFAAALERFEHLFRHPEMMEPTRTWAGVQALVAAMLDEDQVRTKLLSEALIKHFQKTSSEDPRISQAITPVLACLAEQRPPAAAHPPDSIDGAPAMMAWLMIGIHEWQHGDLRKAVDAFRKALAVPMQEDARWFEIHREMAQNHLLDFAMLETPAYGSQPGNLEAAEAALETLYQMRSEVRMRGPISELLRTEIIRIGRLISSFEEITPDPQEITPDPFDDAGESQTTGEDHPPATDEPPVAETPPDEPPPPPVPARLSREEITALISEYRFRPARHAMRELDDDEMPRPARIAWMTVARGAEKFLQTLTEDVKAGNLPLQELRARDGSLIPGVKPHHSGTLADGDGRPLSWSEIHPDSLIDWHRARVVALPEDERIHAHEAAVAFDLLAGNPERALGAIRHLSGVNDHFKTYWELILENYPK